MFRQLEKRFLRPRLQRCLPALFLAFCVASAVAANVPEYRLKVAFLYNFITFTEWESTDNAKFELCIYGKDPFGEHLDQIKDKTIGGKPLSVRQTDMPEQLDGCRVVFIARSAEDRLDAIVAAVRGRRVLTVADTSDAARRGVILNMAMRKGRVSFDVNLQTARDNGLKLNSKLLRLAREVVQ